MSLSTVMRFVHDANSISELAKRLYVHPNVAFNDHAAFAPYRWFKDNIKTSAEVAAYISTEQNPEMICVLIECLANLFVPVNLEEASIEAWKNKNLTAFTCLNRYGIVPDTDILLAIHQDTDFLIVHVRMDRALQAKTNIPSIDLKRNNHQGALCQAVFELGYTEIQAGEYNGNDMKRIMNNFRDKFNESIAKNNFKAFKYLLISNLPFDRDDLDFTQIKIALRLIDDKKSHFIREMCRQGYKFNIMDKNGVSVIEYAVGKIPDNQFDIFFYKAGGLVYTDAADKLIMDTLVARMTDSSAVRAAMNNKILYNILHPGKVVPASIHFQPSKITIDAAVENHTDFSKIKTNPDYEPKIFSRDEVEIDQAPDGTLFIVETNKTKDCYYFIEIEDTCRDSVSTLFYIGLKENTTSYSYSHQVDIIDEDTGEFIRKRTVPKTVFISELLDEMFSGVSKGAIIQYPTNDLHNPSPSILKIVIYLMHGIAAKESIENSGVPTEWVNNVLGKLSISDLLEILEMIRFLDIRQLFKPLAYYTNKAMVNISVSQLRKILIDSFAIDDKFEENLTFHDKVNVTGGFKCNKTEAEL